MIDININTPALLFPAITLLMLAYTNRFLSLATLVRKLHEEYNRGEKEKNILSQIKNIRSRINLIRYMQGLGVVSFLCCVLCMYAIYRNWIIGCKLEYLQPVLFSCYYPSFYRCLKLIKAPKPLSWCSVILKSLIKKIFLPIFLKRVMINATLPAWWFHSSHHT